MVFSRATALRNRTVLNHITRRFAGRLPPFALLTHHGRKSGGEFTTPLMIFRVPSGYVIALTYGPDTDWAKFVLAAGSCEVVERGHHVALTEPRLVHDESRRDMPPVIRQFLGTQQVHDFLYLSPAAT